MTITLQHPDGLIRVDEVEGGRAIAVETRNGVFCATPRWVTRYPMELIEHVLRVKGPSHLCDEIRRDEDPRYVQHDFEWEVLSYVEQADLTGSRILDFGSGSGASAVVLARMFPGSAIVGVELLPEFVELARHRAAFYGLESRVTFQVSPDPGSLPPGIGDFDYIMLSAVYEHLLPAERAAVLKRLWPRLKGGGILFVNQTPYRWFPIEMHTTGLPGINFLPDAAALRVARRLSRRVHPDESWSQLLRRGIRGGTATEITRILSESGPRGESLTPSRRGVRDHIGLWYRLSSASRRPGTKRLMSWAFRAIKGVSGVTMVPVLSLAIRKNSSGQLTSGASTG